MSLTGTFSVEGTPTQGSREQNPKNMEKNKIIQFAQSLILLPFLSGTLSLGNMLPIKGTPETLRSVFIQKENIEANGILAFNQAVDQKAKILQVKADAIDSYFGKRNMPLEGTGAKMVEVAELHNLDWRLIPAIAVRESTGGKHQCKKVGFNPFGWASCKIGFKSYDHAIETIATNLAGKNPNTEYHYADKDTKEILQAYNPPSIVLRYAEQVMSIMDTIGEEEMVLLENA